MAKRKLWITIIAMPAIADACAVEINDHTKIANYFTVPFIRNRGSCGGWVRHSAGDCIGLTAVNTVVIT